MLNTVRPGETLIIELLDGSQVRGRFVNGDPVELAVWTRGGEQAVKRVEVATIRLLRHKERRNAVLGGALAGAVAGIGLAASAGKNWSSFGSIYVTGVSIAAGAQIGAWLRQRPEERIVYSRGRP